MKKLLPLGIGLIMVAAGAVFAADTKLVEMTPDSMKWADIPNSPGLKQVVLMGDPRERGPYIERLKIPANTMIPAHTHPEAENVTVISGTLGLGLGEKADKTKAKEFPAGSFLFVPANTPHFALTGAQEVVIQIHGMGPAGMNIIDSAATGSSTKPENK
ncbi:MAG TPA: cupin domain-containing protein [Stellaceae bacterium]|nr:cupin domain-containing protein [Stellaceae bacterium]